MYEYRCASCGKTFEQLRRMRDADSDVYCPECHSPKVERQLSGFAMSGCGSKPGSSRFT
jgi:putative FmdB family regulatory protein